MHVLDVYKSRKHTVVRLKEKDYRIPNEYTVEEVERLLELGKLREEVEDEKVEKGQEGEQLRRFWSLVFDQLEIIFQHYQPELTADDLRTLITHHEALSILGFYDKYRFLQKKKPEAATTSSSSEEESKKKDAERELREMRRMIAFMVTCGFSLLELRKLYIDELFAYYEELIFTLEKSKQVEEGTYAKVRGKSKGAEADDTVNLLRKQLFRSIADRQRPKK